MKLGGLELAGNALGFLADHVDTIIAWMPAIVAGFVAWQVATQAMGTAMFGRGGAGRNGSGQPREEHPAQ